MLASLTYGASKKEAMKHFALARKLLPDSAIARIGEANGLVMLFGKAKVAEAEMLYKEAPAASPPTRCKGSTPSTPVRRRRARSRQSLTASSLSFALCPRAGLSGSTSSSTGGGSSSR